MNPHDREAVAHAILALVAERGAGKSICPSEAARRLDPARWRDLMPLVRVVAGDLWSEGRVSVTQRGEAVDPACVRGPIRLSAPASSGAD
jgi:fructosamine-3-kinase